METIRNERHGKPFWGVAEGRRRSVTIVGVPVLQQTPRRPTGRGAAKSFTGIDGREWRLYDCAP